MCFLFHIFTNFIWARGSLPKKKNMTLGSHGVAASQMTCENHWDFHWELVMKWNMCSGKNMLVSVSS